MSTAPTWARDHSRNARRVLLTCTLAAAVTASLLGTPAVAVADSGQGTQEALTTQYTSMSGALLNLYATNSGKTLSDYLSAQQVLLTPPEMTDPVAVAVAGADAAGSEETLPSEPSTPDDPAIPTPTVSAPTGTSPTATDPNVGGAGSPAASVPVPQVAALGTKDALGAVAAAGTPVNAATLGDLNRQLTAAGVTVDVRGYASLDALARGIAAKSHTLDGTVTLAGAKWMSSLATLRTPTVKTPQAAMASIPGLPKDALVFGLFADKSLARMISASPNLFASTGKAGLGSPALTTAWNKSMMSVYNDSKSDFSKVLPDACTGGMLAVMATGNASSAGKFGSGCSSSCVTGGLYLNSQTAALFGGSGATTKTNPYSNLWNGSTLSGLQRWQQQQIIGQNPQLTAQLLGDTASRASASCKASKTATSAALGATLPGIFGQLRTK